MANDTGAVGGWLVTQLTINTVRQKKDSDLFIDTPFRRMGVLRTLPYNTILLKNCQAGGGGVFWCFEPGKVRTGGEVGGVDKKAVFTGGEPALFNR